MFNAQTMDQIASRLNAETPQLDRIIPDIIKSQEKRDAVINGLYRRYMLIPASRFEFDDPRMADGVPIFARPKVGNKENHKIHVAFDRTISTQKASYIGSNILTVFDDEVIGEDVQDAYDMIETANDVDRLESDSMEACADRGVSYWLLQNREGRIAINPLNEWETVVIKNPMTDRPQYGMHYINMTEVIGEGRGKRERKVYLVEWYDGLNVSYYKGYFDDSGEGVFQKTSVDGVDTKPHSFGTVERPAVPIIELPNNKDRIGNVELILSLADSYDLTLADLSSELAQVRLAYLVMSGAGLDPSMLSEQLKKTGIILLDGGDGSKAEYISKTLDSAAVTMLRDTLRNHIFQQSFSYDPDAITSGGSPTKYQIEQKYNLQEQDAEKTEAQWQAAFRYMDYCIRNFLTTLTPIAEYDILGISRLFRRNIPRNELQDLIDARNAGIMLPNKVLIELSGLDVDPDRVEELLTEEQMAGFELIGGPVDAGDQGA